MIEVGVGDEDEVHRRQFAQFESGTAQAFQDEEPAREVGVDDDVVLANLKKKAGMSDEGDTKFAVRDEFRLMGLSGQRGDRGIPHQACELAGTLTKCGILQGRL